FSIVEFSDLLEAPPSEPERIIDPIIPAEAVTVLAAHGGAGKSMLALQMAVCCAAGIEFEGLPVKGGHVIFYSAEDPKRVVLRRLWRIVRKKELDPRKLAEKLTIVDATDGQ